MDGSNRMKVNCSICNNEFEYDPYWNDTIFVGGHKPTYICPGCIKEGHRKADGVGSEAKHKIFLAMSSCDKRKRK